MPFGIWSSIRRGIDMESGYVKVSRSLSQNWLIQHPNALAVFMLFLVEAQWRPRKYATQDGIIDLLPGQWVTAIRPLSTRLKMSEKKIRHALELLTQAQTISIKTTHRFSIITLQNWEQYQTQEKEGHTRGTVGAQSGHKNKKAKHLSIKEEDQGPQPDGWNPFGVLMEIFKDNNVMVTLRDPKQVGIVQAYKKKVDEKTFRSVASTYCLDKFCQQGGLSVNGFINNFDRLLNKATYKPVDEAKAVSILNARRLAGGR